MLVQQKLTLLFLTTVLLLVLTQCYRYDTAQAEALGDSSTNAFAEMAFSIDKSTVTAVTRALKAEYTMELAQDLKAIHGLDAETELANILVLKFLLKSTVKLFVVVCYCR